MKYKKSIILLLMTGVSAGILYDQRGFNHQSPSPIAIDNHGQNRNYQDALRWLWTRVYPQTGKTLYCNAPFSTTNRQQRRRYVNAEHIFPMAWVTKALHCGTRKNCQKTSKTFRLIESDLHNIYPAKIVINKARGSYRLGEISGEKREFGRCDFEVSQRQRVAEPAPDKRGEIARAMRYMAYQYGLPLHRKNARLMRQWDRADPPSAEEKRRHQIISALQGNDNPFISHYPFDGKTQ